ncbi:hypothetical protein GJ496_004007 [Pomphorhynchus laevis]|nr:hypothetical protein GJ496_004007 [Pomphorhynchus laevis]
MTATSNKPSSAGVNWNSTLMVLIAITFTSVLSTLKAVAKDDICIEKRNCSPLSAATDNQGRSYRLFINKQCTKRIQCGLRYVKDYFFSRCNIHIQCLSYRQIFSMGIMIMWVMCLTFMTQNFLYKTTANQSTKLQ